MSIAASSSVSVGPRPSNSPGGGSSPSPASDTPIRRTPPSGTAPRASRWATAVSVARSVVASVAVSERVWVAKSVLRILTVTVRAARSDDTSRRCAASVIRATASCTAVIVVRSASNVVSALTCFAAPRGATGRSSMPRASRCSSVPIATPRTSVASRRSSAARAPTVRTPSRCSAVSATGPIPHSARTGSGASTCCSSSGATTRSPSGFASSDAILASCLPEPAPTDAGSPVRVRTAARRAVANSSTSVDRRPGQCGRLEERLVQGHGLDDRRRLGEHGHHLLRHRRVEPAAGRQHDGVRTQPPRLPHRHRRPGPEHPGLVAGPGHDPAGPGPADEHGPVAQRRTGELLDGRVERVHVEVQHPPTRTHRAIVPPPTDSFRPPPPPAQVCPRESVRRAARVGTFGQPECAHPSARQSCASCGLALSKSRTRAVELADSRGRSRGLALANVRLAGQARRTALPSASTISGACSPGPATAAGWSGAGERSCSHIGPDGAPGPVHCSTPGP